MPSETGGKKPFRVGCPVKRILILAACGRSGVPVGLRRRRMDGPLAAAHAGKFLCLTPDVHDKTCQITGVYSWDLFGHITSRFDMGLTDSQQDRCRSSPR